MKKIRKQTLMGIVALGLGAGAVAAYADGPGCEPMGAGRAAAGDHQQFAQRFQDRMAKRQAELHDKLKLNASQEAAWNSYVGKMKPAGRPVHPDRAEFDKLSAPERMDKMLAMMKERDARMQDRVAATKTFYAMLTPEQRKTFDEAFRHGPERHGRPG